MRSQLSFEPHLLLDLRLEAGYTFAPFGGGREGGREGNQIIIINSSEASWDQTLSCGISHYK